MDEDAPLETSGFVVVVEARLSGRRRVEVERHEEPVETIFQHEDEDPYGVPEEEGKESALQVVEAEYHLSR